MKTYLVAVAFLFVASISHADIEIIKSPLSGTAIQGPNGLLQVAYPKMPGGMLNGTNSYFLHGDNLTGAAACKLLGKDLFKAIFEDAAGTYTAGFDADGVIYQATDPQNLISLLVCK